MPGPAKDGQRVAFFGGSFDPPHLGHLAIARAARDSLALDTVLFAPVGYQPLKPKGSTASFADRVAMTELAIANESGFSLSLVDAPTAEGKPNYTLETLGKLRAELPAGSELFCLMGADSFLNLRLWHGAAQIPFAASLIVASRPGQALNEMEAVLPAGLRLEAATSAGDRRHAGRGDVSPAGGEPVLEVQSYRLLNDERQAAPFYVLPGLDVEISASQIRRQVRGARDPDSKVRGLIPPSVSNYIRARGLYR